MLDGSRWTARLGSRVVRNVLGIPVDPTLVRAWRGWFAPDEQPFKTSSLPDDLRDALPEFQEADVSPEVRDTFLVYSRGWQLLSREQFQGLPAHVRRALLAGRDRTLRPVVWPEDLIRRGDDPLLHYVEVGVMPSRHAEVAEDTWRSATWVLPQARVLAGTFPHGSGPNCFGTVMAAAGVAGAEDEWMFQEPFERWLAEWSKPVEGRGHDGAAGTVLVWRDAEGLAQHAAVTLGDGWALSKPSQAWCSPRLVWDVRSTILRGRRPGSRLYRHRLLRAE